MPEAGRSKVPPNPPGESEKNNSRFLHGGGFFIAKKEVKNPEKERFRASKRLFPAGIVPRRTPVGSRDRSHTDGGKPDGTHRGRRKSHEVLSSLLLRARSLGVSSAIAAQNLPAQGGREAGGR